MTEEHFSEYRAQTRVKHAILKAYLRRWMSIQRGKTGAPRQFCFVDTFAGQGRFETGEEGSPIIAMQTGQELFDSHKGQVALTCLFVEIDDSAFVSLEREVARAKAQCPSVRAEIRKGAFLDLYSEIQRFKAGNGPALCFVDPFGYSDAPVDLVSGLLSHRYDEVLVNFMSSFVNRALADESKADTLTRLYCSEEWRSLQGQLSAVHLYGRKVQELAAPRRLYVYPVGVSKNASEQYVYHLLHISQHPRGRQAMEEAVRSSSDFHQLDFELVQPDVQSEIVKLIDTNGPILALDIAGALWLQEKYWHATWHLDISEALIDLESAGSIVITHTGGQNRKRGSKPRNSDVVALRSGRD